MHYKFNFCATLKKQVAIDLLNFERERDHRTKNNELRIRSVFGLTTAKSTWQEPHDLIETRCAFTTMLLSLYIFCDTLIHNASS